MTEFYRKRNLVNLTSHPINLVNKKGEMVVIKESGIVARTQQSAKEIGVVDDSIAVIQMEFGTIVGVPNPRDNVIYIVSAPVLNALNGTRKDCVAVHNTRRVDGQPRYAQGLRING
jgi:hypothetical protein